MCKPLNVKTAFVYICRCLCYVSNYCIVKQFVSNQIYIFNLEMQVAQSEAEKKLKKDDKKKELQELNELFKPVVAAQKISKGKI